MDSTAHLFFVLAISLHNIEEAIWLPGWSSHAGIFHREVNPYVFRFAVILITLLAYLATVFFLFFPEIALCKYIYFGFVGAMTINVLVPHLTATLVLRRYMPGLFTGVFLLWPVNGLILYFAGTSGLMSWLDMGISTIVVGGCLLMALPLFFKLGRLVQEYL